MIHPDVMGEYAGLPIGSVASQPSYARFSMDSSSKLGIHISRRRNHASRNRVAESVLLPTVRGREHLDGAVRVFLLPRNFWLATGSGGRDLYGRVYDVERSSQEESGGQKD